MWNISNSHIGKLWDNYQRFYIRSCALRHVRHHLFEYAKRNNVKIVIGKSPDGSAGCCTYYYDDNNLIRDYVIRVKKRSDVMTLFHEIGHLYYIINYSDNSENKAEYFIREMMKNMPIWCQIALEYDVYAHSNTPLIRYDISTFYKANNELRSMGKKFSDIFTFSSLIKYIV